MLLALQADRRRALAIAGAIAAAFVLPLLLTGAASGQPGAAAQTGSIFQPWQVWWFLGSTGEVIRGADGVVKEGYRAAPGWVSPLSHPLIVGLALPLSLLAWRRRSDPLLLLALLFVLRCVLDPWNTAYYALPAVIALLVWEATRTERPPLLALASRWRRGRRGNGSSPRRLPTSRRSSTSAGACRSSACWRWRLYAPALPAMPALSTGGRASVWSTTQ